MARVSGRSQSSRRQPRNALPLGTDGNPCNGTDAADVDALRQDIFDAQTFARGMIRYRETANEEWE